MSSLPPSIPVTNWIAPDLLEQEAVWGADLYCGPAAQILLDRGKRRSLRELRGSCLEGWRVSTNREAEDYDTKIEQTAIYRQANLDYMRFKLDMSHWDEPTIEADWCVQPGDVVLNKLVPIRAVLVTSRAYRHPVDANCLIIRGLDRPTAAWVAFCLNQPAYEAYLTQHQGLAVLPRVSLRELRLLQVPDQPVEMRQLGEQLWELNDQWIESEEALVRCMKEVEASIAADLLNLRNDEKPRAISPLEESSGWGHYVEAASIEDSLVPVHVENADWRRRLKRNLNWMPITKLRVLGGLSRERLNKANSELAYVQLGDVDDMLMLKPIQPTAVGQFHRIFRQALAQGEVLVSTFIANPRVAFVDRQPEMPQYVSDHWVRLRFAETAGAWALVLNAKPIQEQFAGLAMGTSQQFMSGEAIEQVLLPNVEWETRKRWEDCLVKHHRRKHELNHQFQQVLNETTAVFYQVHPLVEQVPRISAEPSRRQEAMV
jgi:hypothetical protein